MKSVSGYETFAVATCVHTGLYKIAKLRGHKDLLQMISINPQDGGNDFGKQMSEHFSKSQI